MNLHDELELQLSKRQVQDEHTDCGCKAIIIQFDCDCIPPEDVVFDADDFLCEDCGRLHCPCCGADGEIV